MFARLSNMPLALYLCLLYLAGITHCVSLELISTRQSLQHWRKRQCEGTWGCLACWHLCHILWHQASFRHLCSWQRPDVVRLKTDESSRLVHLQKRQRSCEDFQQPVRMNACQVLSMYLYINLSSLENVDYFT